MAHLSDLYSSSNLYAPWVAFLIGLGGSAHCVGMCGGLVLACAPTKKSNISYQLGRLISYSLLGLLGGSLGTFLIIDSSSIYMSLIPTLFIGLMFIFWGVKSWNKKSATIKVPKQLSRFGQLIMSKTIGKEYSDKSWINSLIIGLVSILLPCGFLYGVVIALVAFQSPTIGLLGMMGFWLGTVPAMSFAPGIIQKFLRPVARKLPRLSAIILVSLGLITISVRVYNIYFNNACH